jgi:hypothetical protein
MSLSSGWKQDEKKDYRAFLGSAVETLLTKQLCTRGYMVAT